MNIVSRDSFKGGLKSLYLPLVACFVLSISSLNLYSQKRISGVVNTYSKVLEWYISTGKSDSIKLENPERFNVGDTVMIFTPRGLGIDESDGEIASEFSNAGVYAILGIQAKYPADSTFVFNTTTGFAAPGGSALGEGETCQLIKIPSFDRDVIVEGTLRAREWDPDSSIGGVLALFVKGKITLEADINVSGQGFLGADPSLDDYNGGCYSEASGKYRKRYYSATEVDSAGLKGGGPYKYDYTKLRGKGKAITAGGGGNAKFAGGGGGGNYNGGGYGGSQILDCVDTDSVRGAPGMSLGATFYKNYSEDNFFNNRILFGGGGGTGTSTQLASAKSTRGGDGGGIVIILADTLVSNSSVWIRAEGESVTETATAAGGGGGGGGCIILDVNRYIGDINLSVKGGKGGNTNGVLKTGPGGGGGGGIYWLSQDTTGNINPVIETSSQGFNYTGVQDSYGARAGNAPASVKDGLLTPLKGFIVNVLPRDATVCSDTLNLPINAAYPKGGNGTYTYRWEKSTEAVPDPFNAAHWQLVAEGAEYEDITIPALTETTHFRRIVTSNSVSDGESTWVTYTVLPKIENNLVQAEDLIACYGGGLNSDLEHVPGLSGANVGVDETYTWQVSADGISGWTAATGTNNNPDYTASNLVDTTFFRRKVKSGVCYSYSNNLEVVVLNKIGNNIIQSRDTLCYGQVPDPFTAGPLTGGDPSFNWYKWRISDRPDVYLQEAGTTASLTIDTAFHSKWFIDRIVYSGQDSSCIDTSSVHDEFFVEVHPLIHGNAISSPLANDPICYGYMLPVSGASDSTIFTHPDSVITGGSGIYKYEWQSNTDGAGWITDSIYYDEDRSFNKIFKGATVQVRRIVKSGADDVCQQISNEVSILTLPDIRDNILTIADPEYCQNEEFTILDEEPEGGNNSYVYTWQLSKNLAGQAVAWKDTIGDDRSIGSVILNDSTIFRRIVWSNKNRCVDTSAIAFANIHPGIMNYQIIGGDNQICSGDDLLLEGAVPARRNGYEDFENYHYSWFIGNTPANVNTAVFKDSISYRENDFTETRYIRRVVTGESGICSASDTIEMHAIKIPASTIVPWEDGYGVCEDEESVSTVGIDLDLSGNYDDRISEYEVSMNYTVSGGEVQEFTETVTAAEVVSVPHSPQTDNVDEYVYSVNSIYAPIENINSEGCVAEAGLHSGETRVNVFQSPVATIIKAPAVDTCGAMAELEAETEGFDSGKWIYESSAATVEFEDDSAAATTSTIGFNEGSSFETVKYSWVVVANVSGGAAGDKTCSDTAFTEVIHYRDPLEAIILTADTSVVFADTLQIRAYAPDYPIEGFWHVKSGSPGVVSYDSTLLGNTVSDLVVGVNNQFYWTVENGRCGPYTDSLTIFVEDLHFYNGFSPNGDDVNDMYAIKGLHYGEIIYCYIYNSWGALVREIVEDPSIGRTDISDMGMIPTYDEYPLDAQVLWDGKRSSDNERVVEDGVYYLKMVIRRYEDDTPYVVNKAVVLKSSIE